MLYTGASPKRGPEINQLKMLVNKKLKATIWNASKEKSSSDDKSKELFTGKYVLTQLLRLPEQQ